jgi:hypothetical protein
MNYSQLTPEQLALLMNNPKVVLILLLLSIWALVWKGFALWKASKNNSISWFVVLLALNTLGILEIVYIFFFSKKNKPVI